MGKQHVRVYVTDEIKEWFDKQPRIFSISEFGCWCFEHGIKNIEDYQKDMDEEEKVLNTD